MDKDVDVSDEDDFHAEVIERRDQARAHFEGLTARIRVGPGQGTEYEVLEASRIGFFLRTATPDALPLGGVLIIELSYRDLTVSLGGEIIRKELEPRQGVAVLIRRVTAADKLTYRQILLGLAQTTRET